MSVEEIVVRMSDKIYLQNMGRGKLSHMFKCTKDDITEAKRIVRGFKLKEIKRPRLLFLDIETAPTKAYCYGLWDQNINIDAIVSNWFILSWAAKFADKDGVMSQVLNKDEVLHEDDSRIVSTLWSLLNQVDIVSGHNCVEVNTPILRQDLIWTRAGDIKIGDKLVGFEEKTIPGDTVRDKNKKWKGVGKRGRNVLPTTVIDFNKSFQNCFEISFNNGDKVTVTNDHYWLGMAEKDQNQRWYKTENLRIGQRVNKFLTPWEVDTSYESGWLSGFISGEGTLKGANIRGSSGSVTSIDFCQRPTVVLDQALEYCKKLSIALGELKTKIGGLGKGDTLYTYTLGGKWKTLEILGKLQIKRLINKIDWEKFGGLSGHDTFNGSSSIAVITGIRNVGLKEIAMITTTEKTFIASGYPMHNCERFDIPKIKTRFLINGLPPTKPYLQIDTLKIARKEFGFSSNKLDYIADILGIDRKIKTDINLWVKCMEGDEVSLKFLQEYNKKDVLISEQVYYKLRPYMKSHPNFNMWSNINTPVCPHCGSNNLIEEKSSYYTQTGQYRTHRCLDCGAVSREKKSILPKEKSILVSIPGR